ncbi:ADP-ribosylglycohydrolase family protein [Dethiobacter alkaliphilus]|uniref:ADP-ribosylglycohydrolase family protein n=1 Tax=Dethiobacter alkaliphilus TaxID=427926 RepID=UPI002227ADA0|nr:ADP-ribosylglycohydrolase family protein [Dethiobacter alkaliphilus]MCW3489381.1 ADP-ribosylglycohydrolase family protein [Dethiobacter alkaliphilus]
MLGAIIGDIIGSVYECNNTKSLDFPLFTQQSRFTDDTVLTVATADALLNDRSFRQVYQDYYHRYPQAGYGGNFARWAKGREREPYGSFGNGSAMRVGPVGYACNTLEEVLAKAAETAAVSHNHPEGIKGAKAVAAAVFMSRNGAGKDEIAAFITQEFGYDLTQSLDSVRPWYSFDVSCQGSVPYAIRAFLESRDFTHSIRLAVSIGGDSDTLACMAGAMAEAYYKEIPPKLELEALRRLPADLKKTIREFYQRYMG